MPDVELPANVVAEHEADIRTDEATEEDVLAGAELEVMVVLDQYGGGVLFRGVVVMV